MARHVSALLFGSLLLSSPLAVHAQSAAESEPPPAFILPTEWCTLPLCRDAEGMRRSGDLAGALKLYHYIQEEVDVDEKVLRKPLLWYAIAVIYLELRQPREGQEALAKYQQYIAPIPDSELPAGQRREEVERLAQELRNVMGRLRIVSKAVGTHVLIDGKEVGVTPFAETLPIAPGPHRVEIGASDSGEITEAQEVEVPAGQEVVLWPLKPPAPKATPPIVIHDMVARKGIGKEGGRPGWRIGLGVVGIASGITMLSFGAAALAADGHCASGASSPCPIEPGSSGLPVTQVVDGRATGGALLASGLILSAVGAVLIALPAKRRPVTAAVSFSTGVSLRLATSF